MQLQLDCRPFSEVALYEAIREASGMPEGQDMPAQARYLVSYLRHDEAVARAMLIERPYVDRHFITEYQGYYSTALRAVSRHTTRLHFFTSELDLPGLKTRLAEADAEGRRELQEQLQEAYLGFTVLRPLAAAPIGRTVLRWYKGHDARCFGPQPPPHRVHLLGMRLKAHGVQFQQQDQAVGACATAAVWCALAAVTRRDGGRAPTPLSITERANRSVPTGRALPAVAGLTIEQIIGAINASGYSPDVFKPADNPAAFQLQLMTYVRSGIPVVLQVKDPDEADAHVMAVVGFRVADMPDGQILEHPVEGKTLRAKGMTRLYVHDDRIGPYARMVWVDTPGGVDPRICCRPYVQGFERFEAPMQVWNAIAPLYPKIRISAYDLLSAASEVWPMARWLAGELRDDVLLESSFSLGGSYLRDLFTLGMDGGRAVDAASTILLSRYVGVLRFTVRDEWLLDVVCDATDIRRGDLPWSSMLAVLPADGRRVQELERHAERGMRHVVVA